MSAREVFGPYAAEYERYRPGYPDELWTALVGESNGRSAVDLGSGTGRATVALARRGLSVTGVEPEAGMRREAEGAVQDLGLPVAFIEGSAERTGLAEGCVDLVLAAQSFHWFDAEGALRECCRLLRPGGTLALVWNDRVVDGVPVMEAYEALVERYNSHYRRGYRQRDWLEVIAGSGLFEAPRLETFDHSQVLEQEDFVALSLTASYVRSALDEAALDRFTTELRALLREHLGAAALELGYRARLYRALRP